MPAVINVGGPVAWGLVVLLSASAIRVGRAIAGRLRARRKELEDEALLRSPNAHQPRYLQRLSAAAIRMLIETGTLPCAVLELADGVVSPADSGGRGRGAAGSSDTMGAAAASHRGPAAAATCASAPSRRIVPPELAASVPCLRVAAWMRALSGPEAWRAELTTAAAAAGGGATSTAAAGPSLRSSHAPSYGSSVGRDGGGISAMQSRPVLQPVTAGAAAQSSQPVSAATGAGDAPLLNGQHGCGPGAQPAPAPEQQQHRSAAPDPWVGLSAPGGSHQGGDPEREGIRASGGSAIMSLAAAAATSTNMAILPYPPRHALLVVLGRSERTVSAVTAAAAAAGYSRVAVWVGPAESFAAASLAGPRLPAISRHALWLALGLGPEPLFHVPALVLDVRRQDERLLYGAIRGTVNIPADELAASLALPPAEFRRRHGVPQPGPGDVVVLHSRAGRRAAWAAQVCWDAGLTRVYVYGEGVSGWLLEERVKPYRAYDMGALPPDAEPFSPEEPDEATGFQELHKLGLPLCPGPRPPRFSVATNPLITSGAGSGAGPAAAAGPPAAASATMAGAAGDGSAPSWARGEWLGAAAAVGGIHNGEGTLPGAGHGPGWGCGAEVVAASGGGSGAGPGA